MIKVTLLLIDLENLISTYYLNLALGQKFQGKIKSIFCLHGLILS